MASPFEPARPPEETHCPNCRAMLTAPGAKCWLCGGRPWPVAPLPERYRPLPRLCPSPLGGPLQFGLASLLLFMTLCAILFSIISMTPGVGIALTVLAIPPLIRTCLVATERSQSGYPMSSGGKATVFLVTLLWVFAIIVAVVVAFAGVLLATCAVGSLDGSSSAMVGSLIVGIIAGIIAAMFVVIGLVSVFCRLSQKQRDKRI